MFFDDASQYGSEYVVTFLCCWFDRIELVAFHGIKDWLGILSGKWEMVGPSADKVRGLNMPSRMVGSFAWPGNQR
jgi:hypothetical protein